MYSGVIVEINSPKGYGFIKEIESGQLICFDIEEDNLKFCLNSKVGFKILELDLGKIAFNLQLVD